MHAVSVTVSVLALFAAPTLKDPVGVEAIVERVELLPNAQNPNAIRIVGAFVVGFPHPTIDGAVSYMLGRGYLYYRLNEAYPEATLAEWQAIQRAAGTGTAISFGARGGKNGRLRMPYSPASEPDIYPLGLGFAKDLPAHRMIWHLTHLAAAVSPAPNDTIAAGEGRLVAWPAVRRGLAYTFEIETDGEVKQSPPISVNASGELAWTLPFAPQPGKAYRWRVWVAGGARPPRPSAVAGNGWMFFHVRP
jgi:hypothetical protein